MIKNTQIVKYDDVNTNGTKKPYNAADFESFCVWLTLPSLLKRNLKLAQQMGIDDDYMLELLSITNQTMFAYKFGLGKQTMVRWKAKADADPKKYLMPSMRRWGKQALGNVLASLYNTAIKKGNAAEVKLYFELMAEWSQKMEVETIPPSDATKDMLRGIVKELTDGAASQTARATSDGKPAQEA